MVLGPVVALACGPFFPNRILFDGEATLTSAPVADFTHELDRNPLRDKPVEKANQPKRDGSVYHQTAGADVAELAEALRKRGAVSTQTARTVAAYAKFRGALQAFAANRTRYNSKDDPLAGLKIDPVPGGLPGEFADYLTGAVAYHRGDLAAARRAWVALLARPAAERRYRSVWAAYMLGRSYVGSDADEAARYFVDARKLARAGFRDSLGLAAASYGWEGKAHLNAGRFDRAIELYVRQRQTGDTTATASLMLVAAQVLRQGDTVLRRCAANEQARQVVTAYVLSKGATGWASWGDDKQEQAVARRWIDAIESVGGEADIDGAERLAWLAYQAADYDTAARWVRRAGDHKPIALWVRAKLLMRAGRVDEALAVLGRAAKLMPANEVWPDSHWYGRVDDPSHHGVLCPRDEMLAEMGALQLTRGQYVEALTLLLDSGAYWTDAAYIADQVLTLDELKSFVDARKRPAGAAAQSGNDGFLPQVEQDDALRKLLARRLTRNGRWKEARPYFSPERRKLLDTYIASIRAGHDKSRSRAARAQSFMTAARIARANGMELLGTELEPDEAVYDGQFGDNDPQSPSLRAGLKSPVLRPTTDELRRVVASRPNPMRRWHYRYTAADHAWSAAQLMNDDTDQLAAWLQEAGMWLAARDPKSADRFYKAMVRRCGSTALGREAGRLRWFPAMKRKG